MRNTDKAHILHRSAPAWLWRGMLVAAAMVSAGTLLGALMIALGATDPPRADRRVWASDGWPARAVTLAPGEAGWETAPVPLPDAATFALKVRARLADGSDPGATWGVWLEASDGARLVYALSGEGYLTTRRCPPGDLPPALEDCPSPLPEWRWAAYPRLKSAGESNHLAAHREAPGQVRLWLNRERLGVTTLAPAGAWGVWWRGGRGSAATLEWERAALYQD